MRDNPQPNPYNLHPWYQMQQQEQMQKLQKQGFVKKKGCNCGGKKKNTSDQQNQG
ncbi:cytochrome C oxidase subunit III [Bacillus sp. DX4.1]|uniref:cytochrome C oxidase subunit III n=1 Tax=Bacillus sp. DX4.1 TaxID=3055867 RepID=UPI0025A160B5|nr:cytochrome C oxidase subunit III [Bacillus sp. DX4.1]MDM5187517.1 cytochrome C oxidase subunit III [Bacillus sp. DX4.1]